MYRTLLFSSLAAAILYGFFKLFRFWYRSYTSPLRRLPGPPSSSFLWGNLKAMREAGPAVLQQQWLEQYGGTLAYPGFFGVRLASLHSLGTVLNRSNPVAPFDDDRYSVRETLTSPDSQLTVFQGTGVYSQSFD